MITINGINLPKGIINNISYILYYSLIWYIFLFFLILGLIAYKENQQMVGYQLFVVPIFFAIPLGIFTSIIVTPIEKKIIKRNIFVVGLIQVLKNHKSIKFSEIVENYGYFVFQNKKVISRDFEWASYIEALIALGVIELKNHKFLKEESKDFDYNHFSRKLMDAELSLKNKKVDVDELIKRLDNYIL